MPRSARDEKMPDFGKQVSQAGKLDQVDPSVAELIVNSGLDDGDRGDDVISVSRGSWPASALKPSQTSMVLGKALGMALAMIKSGKVGGDLGALVSKDKHILDGHHRWAATILASGSKGKVGGYGADLKGSELLKVLNIISKGMFKVRGGKAGKGSLAQFTDKNVRDMLNDFTEKGIGGPFPWSADSVKETLEQEFGSIEEGVDKMAKNAKLITTSVPSWAPDRKQMPVIEPNQVPSAAGAMSQGEVDWNDPYRKEGALRTAAIRLASAEPVGSPLRKALLNVLSNFNADEIGDLENGALESDTDEQYMGGNFTEQEFDELSDLQVGNRLASSDRKSLVRLASTLPKGSAERRAILSGLKKVAGKYGFIAFYKNKKMEVWADSALAARDIAAEKFKARRPYDVSVVLAEKDGKQVTHLPLF